MGVITFHGAGGVARRLSRLSTGARDPELLRDAHLSLLPHAAGRRTISRRRSSRQRHCAASTACWLPPSGRCWPPNHVSWQASTTRSGSWSAPRVRVLQDVALRNCWPTAPTSAGRAQIATRRASSSRVVRRFGDRKVYVHPEAVDVAAMEHHLRGAHPEARRGTEGEPGEHFMPRDVVHLMVDLLHITGGETREGEACAPPVKPDGDIHLFDQEVNPETFAICKTNLGRPRRGERRLGQHTRERPPSRCRLDERGDCRLGLPDAGTPSRRASEGHSEHGRQTC